MKQTVVLKFWNLDEKSLLKKLEEIGRVSHLSDQKITEDSCYPFIKMIINQRHLGILEHENITFKIRTNRAIANELVRHRLASYLQNSTRYIKYDKMNFEFITSKEIDKTDQAFIDLIFNYYENLIKQGIRPEVARDFLPLGLGTTIYATMNIRGWLHFLVARSGKENHPFMVELAGLVRKELLRIIPTILETFDNTNT